ncbi:Ribonuclease H2 subunit A [Linum grandiflorum]
MLPVLPDSKTLKEEKREELFESLKVDQSIGWAVDVIDPRELSAKMLKKLVDSAISISLFDSFSGRIQILHTLPLEYQVYVDTVGDPEKYRVKLSERFPSVYFVVAKKADSLYPVVSGASIVAKVTRDRSLREWVFDETYNDIGRKFGSGYPGDPDTKTWLEQHKHKVFGFPALVRFSWGTCNSYFKDGVEVLWEADIDEDSTGNSNGKRQLKLSNFGVTTLKKKKQEEVESNCKGRCKFFETRKLEQLADF